MNISLSEEVVKLLSEKEKIEAEIKRKQRRIQEINISVQEFIEEEFRNLNK